MLDLSPITWLIVDYSRRLLIILAVWFVVARGLVYRAESGTALSTAIVIVGGLFLLYKVLRTALAHLPPAVADLFAYDSYPRIADPGLVAFDLVVGLLLVAASEELAFRGLLPALLEKLTTSPVLIVLVSAVVFGLLHLRFGLGSAINATLLGLAFGVVAIATRRLWIVVAAHYLIDLSGFAADYGVL